MTELIDNTPPLPEPAYKAVPYSSVPGEKVSAPQDFFSAAQYRAGEAAAFARGVAAGRNAGLEEAAKQWDGCMYEGVGETIDIGQAIRSLKQ